MENEDFSIVIKKNSEELKRVLKSLPLLEHRLLIINEREEFLKALIRIFLVNNHFQEKETIKGFVERLNLLFDFRNKRSTQKSIDSKSLEIQIHTLIHEMNQEE
ncbi:MAG: hypothetical protein H6Q13_3096 [Bacteroidetes bacterium]|nr:hypothetical protein [Bacteroidota bacterium]